MALFRHVAKYHLRKAKKFRVRGYIFTGYAFNHHATFHCSSFSGTKKTRTQLCVEPNLDVSICKHLYPGISIHVCSAHKCECQQRHVCIDVRVCVYTYVCPCMYMYAHVCMYVCLYVCMYVCLYVSMYVCMHACMYVYMYVCKGLRAKGSKNKPRRGNEQEK